MRKSCSWLPPPAIRPLRLLSILTASCPILRLVCRIFQQDAIATVRARILTGSASLHPDVIQATPQVRGPATAKKMSEEIEFAIEVFVRGHSAGRSRTFPYEVSRVGPVWVMRDAPRKNPRDYRKEEWIAYDVDPKEADAVARRHTRGYFFVCAMIAEGESDESTRTAYKALGYRLLATEGFFVQRLTRIPRPPSFVSIERVRTPDLAARLGKATRTRAIADDLLGVEAPFRQYVALDGEHIVGRVRSVDAAGATWCTDMYVDPSHRRRGIGQALLAKMLRDDRARGSKYSLLTASHAGALLYPRLGYERIGTLLMFVPRKGGAHT
jgi:GNAT superfamily N-acetyltransferase